MRRFTLFFSAFLFLSATFILINSSFMRFSNLSQRDSWPKTSDLPEKMADFPTDTGKQRFLEGEAQVPNGYLELFQLPFVGTWKSNEKETVELLDDFEKRTGKLRFDFNGGFEKKNRLIWFSSPSSSVLLDKLQMVVINGQYNNEAVRILAFDNSSTSNLNLDTNTLTIYENNTTFDPYTPCDIVLNLDFNDIITKDLSSFNAQGIIGVKMISENCTMNLEGTLQVDNYDYSTTFFYNLFLRIVLLYNAICNLNLALRAIANTPDRERISIITPIAIAVWDMVFLSNMYIPPDFGPTEISKAILFLEMLLYESSPSFLLLVPFWRRTQTRGYLNGQNPHRTLWLYVFLPTFIMIAFIAIAVVAFYKAAFLFVISLYLLPQIIHGIVRGSPIKFELENVIFMIGLRPLLPLYIKGYSSNIFQVKTSMTTVLIVLIIIGVQAGVLYLQALHGARFFLPKCHQLAYHNYLEFSSRESQSQSQAIELIERVKTCKICMEPLKESPVFDEGAIKSIKPILNRLEIEPKKVVRTECRHKFHAGCLVEWMMVKMECPQCGTMLAPLFKK